MKKFKFRALAAILLSVIMLSTSITAAFAAGTDSVGLTSTAVPWSNFPVQKRFSYNTGYTYAIQTVLKYCDKGIYAERLGTVDGKFGEGTEAAVQMFQANNKIQVDGQVGPETWTALYKKLKTNDAPTPLPDSTNADIIYYYYVDGQDTTIKTFRCNITQGIWAVSTHPSILWKTYIQFYPQ